ncbi:uncharacterized protein BJX67DRAFT_376065 [Aspergillus lucknowensis]|uniref:Uncharacterized protein n=1 Tax=Aspergillus lucknowensis TaxID=176173 RepID=A0ABR4L400_9EURO
MKALYHEIKTRKSEIWGDWARPDRPTSVEFQIARHGGRSSAIDLLPHLLQRSKNESSREADRMIHAVYEASYLRAENAYYRKVRRAAVLFNSDVATALLGREALPRLRGGLCQIDNWFRADAQHGASLAPAAGTSQLRTAVDDYSVALDRVTASYQLLRQAHEEFSAALKRIDQEYADFFSVQLSNDPPEF